MGLLQTGVQVTKLHKIVNRTMSFIAPEAVAKKHIEIPSEATLKRFRPRMQFAAEAVGALRFSKSVHAIANHDGASIEQSKVFGESHGLNKINNVVCISIVIVVNF
jgi:hypothetical protein